MIGNTSYVLLSLIPALINLGIIFYVIFFLPRSKTVNIFSFFVLALILWQCQDTILRICDSKESALFWYKGLCIGWISAGPLAFHFACRYTKERKLYSSTALTCVYLPFVVLEAIYQATNNKIEVYHNKLWGWIPLSKAGTLDSFIRYWVSALVVGALFILFRDAYRMRNNKERRSRSLLIAVGILLPAIQGMTTQLIFPLVLHRQDIPVTSAFMTFFSFATIVSFNRYKLFSVSESIRVDKVLENLTNKVLVISPQKKILYTNPHAANVFGIEKGDIFSSLENIFPDSDLYEKFCIEVFDETLKGEKVFNYETSFLTHANKRIEVLVSSQLIINNNIVQGVLLVANNITERIQVLKELEASNERYKYVTQTAFDAIWDWDIKTRQLYLGETFGELFGYKQNVADFSKWASHIHEEDRERVVLSRLNKIIHEDEVSWQDEYRYIRSDGSISFVSDRGILLRKDNSTYRLIGAMQDITQRKKAEEKIMFEKNLKQKEITEAVITAQESERSEIGKELHDNVNQLLGASRLYIQTARQDPARCESLLATASAYTLDAIEEIRKLSRKLISPAIKETGLVEAVINLIENITNVHPIKINFYADNFEEDKLNEKFKLNVFRIIQEQVNNTLKYAKAQTIEISFNQTATRLFISISDDGVGFDTSKKKNGIGISNIHSRAQLYKGEVRIASKPGEGCTLSVIFAKSELLFNAQLASV
jgi:PAS domain S-box-containing protein